MRVDSGSIQLDGMELTRFSESARDRIRAAKLGYVFQTFNLLPAFTALENVKLGMTFSRKSVNTGRAIELLEKVGLKDRLHYLPKQLSVGQQQRVAVARALANKPRLLLADELLTDANSTANRHDCDRCESTRIIQLIRDVCTDEGVAILLVTHSDDVARQFSRVVRFETINLVTKQTTAPESEL